MLFAQVVMSYDWTNLYCVGDDYFSLLKKRKKEGLLKPSLDFEPDEHRDCQETHESQNKKVSAVPI